MNLKGAGLLNAGDKREPRLLVAAPDGLPAWVEVFWQVERWPDEGRAEPYPWYLPVPGFELLFWGEGAMSMPGRGTRSGPMGMLCPPRLLPSRFSTPAPITLWGARLSHGALAELGWCRAEEASRFPMLHEILAPAARPLLEGVWNATGFRERCAALAELLRAGASLASQTGHAFGASRDERALLRAHGSAKPVSDRGEQRAMQRAFERWVGLSPSELRVVQRFDEVIRAMFVEPVAREELAAIAARLGYSDQAHLTRHFRRFAWATPAQFRRRVSEWLQASDRDEP